MMLSMPDGDRLLDAVLNDRLVDQRQHFFRLRLGGGKKPGAEAGGGKDGLADDVRSRPDRSRGRSRDYWSGEYTNGWIRR